jgi:hypothetical protein
MLGRTRMPGESKKRGFTQSTNRAPACAAHLLPLHSHLFTINLFAGSSMPVFGHFGNFFTRSLPDSHQIDKEPE